MSDIEAVSVGALDTTDRRRPGRAAVDPALVPLLRNPTNDGMVAPEIAPEAVPHPGLYGLTDEPRIGAARGIAVAVLVSVPMWVIIGAIAYALLH